MIRPLITLAAIVGAVTALGGSAEARWLVCEAELSLSPLAAPAESPPPKLDDDTTGSPLAPVLGVCRAGLLDELLCWPDPPLPERGSVFAFAWSVWSAVPGGMALPDQPAARLAFARTSTHLLSDGFGRRIERPPRAV